MILLSGAKVIVSLNYSKGEATHLKIIVEDRSNFGKILKEIPEALISEKTPSPDRHNLSPVIDSSKYYNLLIFRLSTTLGKADKIRTA
jgi:hypothetical protein